MEMASVEPPGHAEVAAFTEAANAVAAADSTGCGGWTAHDLVVHVVAGGAEIARLLALHLDGRPVPPTVDFEEREAPFRTVDYEDLLGFLSVERVGALLDAMSPSATLPFTGRAMSAASPMLHIRSELAVHRWDLTEGAGSRGPTADENRPHDERARRLLAQPELTMHAVRALSHFAGIDERAAARTRRAGLDAFDSRIRVAGEPDVRIRVERDRHTRITLADPDGSPALETDAASRLLMLWGRRSPTDSESDTLAASERRKLDAWLFG